MRGAGSNPAPRGQGYVFAHYAPTLHASVIALAFVDSFSDIALPAGGNADPRLKSLDQQARVRKPLQLRDFEVGACHAGQGIERGGDGPFLPTG